MSKQLTEAPVRPDEQTRPSITGSLQALKQREPRVFWPWLGGLLLVGLVIVGVVTFSFWNWINNLESGVGANQNTSSVSTVNVGRSAVYSDLNITWNDLQYTTVFSDDPIHAGAATVRVTLKVNNPTASTVVISYYDVVRLLVPGGQPIVPTNLNLSAAPQKNSTQTGWIDFPVAKNLNLNTLKLQLGNAATSEQLVAIPVTGSYNANQYQMQTHHPSLFVSYYFKGWQIPGYYLNYHLTSVDIRYSYNGVEAKAGQQYYVLNFSVDNPNGNSVNPGYGFDYLRISLSGSNRYPMDNTLPSGFKANAHGVTGHVAFVGPVGLHKLTVVFLRQAVPGWDSYSIAW